MTLCLLHLLHHPKTTVESQSQSASSKEHHRCKGDRVTPWGYWIPLALLWSNRPEILPSDVISCHSVSAISEQQGEKGGFYMKTKNASVRPMKNVGGHLAVFVSNMVCVRRSLQCSCKTALQGKANLPQSTRATSPLEVAKWLTFPIQTGCLTFQLSCSVGAGVQVACMCTVPSCYVQNGGKAGRQARPPWGTHINLSALW